MIKMLTTRELSRRSDEELESMMAAFYRGGTQLSITMSKRNLLTKSGAELAAMAAAGDTLCQDWLDVIGLARILNSECLRRGYVAHDIRCEGEAVH